jgi:hypothetical protein
MSHPLIHLAALNWLRTLSLNSTNGLLPGWDVHYHRDTESISSANLDLSLLA